jgi:hypothetical protein
MRHTAHFFRSFKVSRFAVSKFKSFKVSRFHAALFQSFKVSEVSRLRLFQKAMGKKKEGALADSFWVNILRYYFLK